MPDLLSSCDEMTSNSDKLFIYDTGRIHKILPVRCSLPVLSPEVVLQS